MAHDNGQNGISAAEIDLHLQAVLASRPFRNAAKMQRLLAYLLEAVRSGNEGKLKGYTIGIEALGRSDDFDPQLDPIVRVQARRLRDALDQFYADEGHALPLRIVIEKGSYRPAVLRVCDASRPSPAHSRVAHPGPPTRGYRNWRLPNPLPWGMVFVVGVFVAIVATTVSLPDTQSRYHRASNVDVGTPPSGSPPPPESGDFATRPIIRVHGSGRDGHSLADARFVAGALARYNLFDVRTVAPDDKEADHISYGSSFFDLRFDLCERCFEPNAGLLLVAMPANTVIYSARFSIAEGNLPNGALNVLRRLGSLDGPILGYARRYRDKLPRAIACLGDAYEFGVTFSKVARERLRTCTREYRTSGLADSNMEQLVAFDAIVAYWHLEAVSENLELAQKASYRAIELEPSNARGHLVRALVLGASGDADQAFQAARRSYTLNPLDDITAFGFSNALLGLGEIAEARAILNKVRRESVHVPIWISVNLALTHLLSDDYDSFLRVIPEMRGATAPLGRILLLIAEARGRDVLRLQSTYHELKAAYPLLVRPSIARLYLETHFRNPALAARVVSEFEAAMMAFTESQAKSN